MVIPASARARKARGSKIRLEAWIANVLGMVLVRHPAGSTTFSVTNEPREGTVIPQYSPVMFGRRHKFGPGWFTFGNEFTQGNGSRRGTLKPCSALRRRP